LDQGQITVRSLSGTLGSDRSTEQREQEIAAVRAPQPPAATVSAVLPLPADPDPLRRRIVVVLLFAGIALRLLHQGQIGSDVLQTTRAAIDLVLSGGNPYGHGYEASRPPGAPFAYGPLALLWYALLPRVVELLASSAVLFLLAWTRRMIGLAICALWVPLAVLANDGSNDSSAGLLLLGALVLAERSPRLGAAALALVVAFKPYALAFLPPLIGYAGVSVVAPFVAASLVAWGPAIALWGANNILTSFQMAMQVHVVPYYSLGAILHSDRSLRPAHAVLQAVMGGLTSLASLRWARTPRAMVAWGIVIYAATLFTGFWGTAAYWAAVLPIGAWHVDAWLRSVSPDHPLVRLLAGSPEGNQGTGDAVGAA
jgi:hypothetical protein